MVYAPAMSTPRRFHRVRDVLDRRQPDLTVLLEDVQVPRNLAAILRSCDAVGVLEAHAVWPGGRLKISRPASGGQPQVGAGAQAPDARRSPRPPARQAGCASSPPIPPPAPSPFREVDYTLPTALLLGNEDDGVDAGGPRRRRRRGAIPMEGMGTSLNVSVAAALLLFEAQRQRRAAGFYDRPRLDPETYARTLFEWAYPDRRAVPDARGGVSGAGGGWGDFGEGHRSGADRVGQAGSRIEASVACDLIPISFS